MFDKPDSEKPEDSSNNFIESIQEASTDNFFVRNKTVLLVIAGVAVFALFVIGVVSYVRKHIQIRRQAAAVVDVVEEVEPARLNNIHLEDFTNNNSEETSEALVSGIEYLDFSYFYEQPEANNQEFKFSNYSLPINVKTDIINYYDISRKINLESGLDTLNNQGFVILDNPWSKEANDFYSISALLDDKQIPLFISSDFISYYYQSVLKLAFKDVEEGVFYDSLWKINHDLYEQARTRYELRLAEIGNINDRVLEGERLEAAFFAVSLELLKPQAGQVNGENQFDDGKFSAQEQQQFKFSVPSYLTDDVLEELKLIREAQAQRKSFVLLYDRDYRDFIVPTEYNNNARLHNFYLTAAWLNSVFPLNYRSDNCPECLLDYDDWRVNFTAASFIAQDFMLNQELRNEWARVYKTISFFKGLRDSWNYVDYNDSLKQIFGDNYDIASLFALENPDSEANMENLRQSLLSREPFAMQGAFDLTTSSGFKSAGLQFLADFYRPNDFIFKSLSYPNVGLYQGEGKSSADNVTVCSVQGERQRCQGSSQDILSLIYPDWSSEFFIENGNYDKYPKTLADLRSLLEKAISGNLNNYWASLYVWRSYLNIDNSHLPVYLQAPAWHKQMAASVVGAWTDMQLSVDQLNLRSQDGQSISLSTLDMPDYAWLEPNIDLLDRLLAHNKMILGMFSALGMNDLSRLAVGKLNDAGQQLTKLRAIAVKQAQGESLNSDDTQFIRDFSQIYILEKAAEKSLVWRNDDLKMGLQESLQSPQLLIMIHPVGDKIVFSMGPIFNHQEQIVR